MIRNGCASPQLRPRVGRHLGSWGRAVPLGFGKACGDRAEIARVARIATDCFAHDNADAKLNA
jgi:hypothetical protein